MKPAYADAYINLGAAYRAGGKLDLALSQYQEALRADPARVEAYFNLGNTYRALGRRKEAKDNYQRFINSWKGDPAFITRAKQAMEELK
jgi:tetratricopeptide (TPR) repeat protein